MAESDVTVASYVRRGEARTFLSTVPPRYLLGIGAVITSWGLYELFFDNFLAMMRWSPEAAKLAKQPPNAFWRRADLLKASVRAALPNCPVLTAKMDALADESVSLARKRNDVTHSQWFEVSGQMGIFPSLDGSRQTYVVSPDDLFHLATLISELHRRLIVIQFHGFGPEGVGGAPELPSPEISLLQAHFENNRPKSPDPKRRSKPPRHQPFLL